MKQYSPKTTVWEYVSQLVEDKIQLLLPIWLFLAVLAPHQEMYKVFFHVIVIPSLIILFFKRKNITNYNDPLLFTALLFFLYAAAATFFTDYGNTQSQIRAIRWTIEASFCLLAFWIWMPNVITKQAWWSKFLLWITLLSALAAILKFLLSDNLEGRLSGLGGLHNPIQASSVLVILLAISHFMLVTNKQLNNKPHLILFSVTALSVVLAVLFSESRGPIGALFIYTIFIASIEIWARANIKFGLSVLSFFLAGCIIAVAINGTEQYVADLLSRGMSYRLDIWYGYLNFPPDSWWIGFGLDNDPQMLPATKAYWKPNDIIVTHPHSIFLGTLFETGIIGTLFLITMSVLVIKSIFTIPYCTSLKTRLFGLLLLVSLLGLTTGQGVIYSVKTYWIIIWFPVVYIWMWCKLNRY